MTKTRFKKRKLVAFMALTLIFLGTMYGLDLPDSVLQKLYYKNALKVISGIDASLFEE